MAIWGVVRRKRDSWAIKSENANLGKFDELKSVTENRVENGAG